MGLYLAIDGGGSGCRARVETGDGSVWGEGASGPANIATDPDGARDNILAAATQALGGADPRKVVAGLGLAGANSAGAVATLQPHLPFARATIASDAVTAAMGALGQDDGIVAALGTGSVFAVQIARRVETFGGWGLVLGDEGSGGWIGRAALAAALQAVDGFRAMTPFLRGLIDRHGGPSDVVRWAASARPADFAALAPAVMSSADAGARRIADEATLALRCPVLALRARHDVPVVLIGGLAAAFAPRLADIPMRAPRGTALDGAMMLASRGGA